MDYTVLLLSFALIYFSLLHLRTVLFLFCCLVGTALLFSYSAIFIAASLRNKNIVVKIIIIIVIFLLPALLLSP